MIRSWHGENRDWRPYARPQGYREQLRQGYRMPRGVAWRRLPPGLRARLPTYRAHEWYAVGPDVVLIALATGIVASVLYDAFE